MTIKEWLLLVTLVLLIAIVGTKSILFDPILVNDETMRMVVDKMEEIVDQKHTHILYRYKVITTRIIDVKAEGEDVFRGHYRKYFLSIFPIGDVYFVTEISMN